MDATPSGGGILPWVWGEPIDAVAAGPRPGGSEVRLVTRATVVRASPELVFLWVCQLRRAPYSYDWIDNFGRRSPRTADPAMTELRVGQSFMAMFTLADFVPGESVTLRLGPGWPTRVFGAVAVTYRVDSLSPTRTRLAAVMWFPPIGRVLAGVRRYVLVWGDLLMMRKQLLTLAALAERAGGVDGEPRGGGTGEIRRRGSVSRRFWLPRRP